MSIIPAKLPEKILISPETGKRDAYFRGLWKQALTECEEKLGPHDFQNLSYVADANELISSLQERAKNYGDGLLMSFLSQIQPCLERFREFTTVLALVMRGPAIPTAIIWGMVNLLIELSRTTTRKLTELIAMLDDLAHDLLIFQEYEWIFKTNTDLEETVIKAFIDVIRFWSVTIQYLKKNPGVNALSSILDVRNEFEQTRGRVKKQTERIKERAQARALRRSQPEVWADIEREFHRGLDLSDKREEATLPCENLPWPEDPNFSGRAAILDELHRKLDHDDTKPSFRSFALHGILGIGKTQTALAYAHQRVRDGVKAVLWVQAETMLDIDTSFTRIAVKLGLKGAAESGDHTQNRYLVTTWLQKTSCNWLMIMDNVESPEDLHGCWPSAPRGSILVTSRVKVVAFNPAGDGKLMPPFSPQEGSEYLMKLIARDHYSADEENSAVSFSQELDGHPLALNLVGTKIRRLEKPIRKYEDQYRKKPGRLHQKDKSGTPNMYYPKSLDVLWNEVFGSFQEDELAEETLALLGVLCFMAADNILEDFFHPMIASTLPPSLAFCSDEESFDDALFPLLNRSIVRKDPETGMLSIHRLVQGGFLEWCGPEKAFESFCTAAALLHSFFPVHSNGFGLRNEWKACRQGIAHVLSMCAQYRINGYMSLFPGDLEKFCLLLKSCGWFLMERGSWSEFMDLFMTADLVCEDKEGLIWAHLCNTAGCVEYERGNAVRSSPFMEKSFEIRRRLLPPDDLELSDGYNNYGNMILTRSQSMESVAEALEYFLKGAAINESVPDGEKGIHIRYMNIGSAYTFQQKYQEASEYFDRGRKVAIQTFGPGCHFEARQAEEHIYHSHIIDKSRCDYLEARNQYHQMHWAQARMLYEAALENFKAENANLPVVAATHLKIASIDLKMGKVQEAITRLREAMLISEANEKAKGDQGDTARIMRRLSDALFADKQVEEAESLKERAEKIRKVIQGDLYKRLPDCEESYDMMVFHGDR